MRIYILIIFGIGCHYSLQPPAGSGACNQAEQKHREVRALIVAAPCAAKADCKAKAYGYKSCGGPAEYLIYAGNRVDEARLDTLAAEVYESGKTCAQELKLASTCDVISEPEVGCLESRCVALPPAPPF